MARKRKRAPRRSRSPKGSSTRDIEAAVRGRVMPEGATRHGLVIGIEIYRDKRLNLHCSRADAEAIRDLMIDPSCGMFPEDHVTLLPDEKATKDNIWKALVKLKKAGKSDTVWIYYAGHADWHESELFWLPYGTDMNEVESTGLSWEHISGVLGKIKSERLLVLLDCCHAGASKHGDISTRGAHTAADAFKSYRGSGRVVIASSAANEKSVEIKAEKRGAFTFVLENGLRGGADEYERGEGVVTLDKLWRYLERRVKEESKRAGSEQTPTFIGEMTHGLPLTQNIAATEHKRELLRLIGRLTGFNTEEELESGEALFCAEIVRRGPRWRNEQRLLAALEKLAGCELADDFFVDLAKASFRAAMRERPSSPVAEPYKAPSATGGEGVAATEKGDGSSVATAAPSSPAAGPDEAGAEEGPVAADVGAAPAVAGEEEGEASPLGLAVRRMERQASEVNAKVKARIDAIDKELSETREKLEAEGEV